MTTPHDNLWQQAWYPVAYLDDLDPANPSAFTLLGVDLVLWFDRSSGSWRAFADVCPHRLVPLSQGRLNAAGELECPYHGWSFNGSGRCTAIPQATDGQSIGQRSHCRSYATAAAQGLLFVFSGDAAAAAEAPLPLVPVLQEQPGGWADGWTVQDTFRDLPMDALTLLENVLDVSHVPFTHHATVGRRENAGPVELELTAFGPSGFTGLWQEGPLRGPVPDVARPHRPGLRAHSHGGVRHTDAPGRMSPVRPLPLSVPLPLAGAASGPASALAAAHRQSHRARGRSAVPALAGAGG
jgi:phenylpropionate dioxygenase-like ring-hydroxylating dioxygenase large terminal subunit